MMAGTGADRTVIHAADGVADAAAVQRLLARLEELEASGALDLVVDAVGALKALLDSLTPGVMARMAALAAEAGELADELVYNGRPVLPDALRALGAAAQEAKAWEKAPGLSQLVGMVRDPDTRRGLGFMLAFARQLGKRLAA